MPVSCEEALPPACPVCGGPGTLLGAMGTRLHFRCRDCGMDWSRQAGGPDRPPYCTRPDLADGCEACSLVNYHRDCRNNPVPPAEEGAADD